MPTYLIIHDSTQTHNTEVNIISLAGQSGMSRSFSAMGQVAYSNVERHRMNKRWTLNLKYRGTLSRIRTIFKHHGFLILVLILNSDPCIMGCVEMMTHRTVNARAALLTPCVGEWLTFLARSSTDLSDNLLLSDTEPPFSTDSTSNLRNTSAQNLRSFSATYLKIKVLYKHLWCHLTSVEPFHSTKGSFDF